MKLLVTTPLAVVVDAQNVRYVRAEDQTGAFGILQGHADFLSVLTVSVITWQDNDDVEHHVVVRGGLLTVREGNQVEVATRQAEVDDSLAELGRTILQRFKADEAAQQSRRIEATKMHLAAIRQLQRYLETHRHSASPFSGIPQSTAAGAVDDSAQAS